DSEELLFACGRDALTADRGNRNRSVARLSEERESPAGWAEAPLRVVIAETELDGERGVRVKLSSRFFPIRGVAVHGEPRDGDDMAVVDRNDARGIEPAHRDCVPRKNGWWAVAATFVFSQPCKTIEIPAGRRSCRERRRALR